MSRLMVLLTAAFCLLGAAPPALAADPTAYLSGMPNRAKVEAAFVGSDTLDTAAQRFAAFSRLEDMTNIFIGDRGPAGHAKQAEADLHYAYINAGKAIRVAVQAGMPEDQRGYYLGTQYTAWAQTVDRYQSDAGFNDRFRALFSAAFRTSYRDVLAKVEKDDSAPLVLPYQTAPLTGTAKVVAEVQQNLPFFAWLLAYVVLFALLGPRGAKSDRTGQAAATKGARS